jgi:protein-glutamine gamma-glutamyltransferase
MNQTILIAPPFGLLGCTLLFWGWQTDLLIYAIIMAILIELPRWTEWRWDLSDKDFNRLMDLTSLLWLGTAIYLFNRDSIQGLFILLSWMPIIFFLLIMTQLYSQKASILLSSIFLSLRHYHGHNPLEKNNQTNPAIKRIHLGYPYFVLGLLAASAGQTHYFFIGIFLLITWALWTIRPRHYRLFTWVFFLIFSFSLGYLGHVGLYRLQNKIETMIVNWFQDLLWRSRDPYRQNTAIGDIGELKQSDRILLRVYQDQPGLLREATYNSYYRGTWQAQTTTFKDLIPVSGEDSRWLLTPVNHAHLNAYNRHTKQANISMYLPGGTGMLALPLGSFLLDNLALPDLMMNDFGAVKVARGPGLIHYQAHYNSYKNLVDNSPLPEDFKIPEDEQPVFEQLVHELDLIGKSPEDIIKTVNDYFTNNFHYSLLLSVPTYHPNITPLRNFLYYKRAGHCEYFATATVLLMRAAGLPARYATGFAVEEYSELENAYLVRKRHAHAWSLVYVNDRWQEIDTTPSVWLEKEAECAAWWQPIYDVWSWLYHRFSLWRWDDSKKATDVLLWLLVPLISFLLWRLFLKERIKQKRLYKTQIKNNYSYQGIDSAFFKIVHYLQKLGYIRQPGETLPQWLQRLEQTDLKLPPIQSLLFLHQRYRFDSQSLTAKEQQQFIDSVTNWLTEMQRLNQSKD